MIWTPPRLARTQTGFLVLSSLLLTALAYWQGLNGPFVFDDYANLVDGAFKNLNVGDWQSLPQIAMASQAGPLRRPISMGSFGVNFLLTGLDPFWFKLTNLGIHLLNGLLVWRIGHCLLRLTGSTASAERWIPLAGMAIWMLHPMQLTSVLYVVQRMTSLSGTFVLLGTWVYLRARARLIAGEDARLVLWCGVPVCLMLAALAKENGVLLMPLLAALEVSLLRFRCGRHFRVGNLQQFFGVLLVVPMLAVAFYFFRHPAWLTQAESIRDFTPLERMLTELRVLFLYLRLLLVPDPSQYGLFYDDFPISRGLLSPLSTLYALLAWGALLVSALAGRNRWPWFSFAVLWFLAAHALESSFVMLELVHLHRNYLACLGPMLALLVGIHQVLGAKRPRLTDGLIVVLVLVLAATTALRADQWRDQLTLARFELMHRPASPRANYEAGRVLAELAVALKHPAPLQSADVYLRRAATLAPRDLGALVALGLIAGGPFPADAYAMLESRLKARPVNAIDVVFMRSLTRCSAANGCKIPPQEVVHLFSVMLEHPQIDPVSKASLLSALGLYFANALGDVPGSVRLLREAVTLLPDDAELRLNLAQALMFLPDYDAAEAELDAAQRLDTLAVQASMQARVRDDLKTMRAAAAGTSENP